MTRSPQTVVIFVSFLFLTKYLIVLAFTKWKFVIPIISIFPSLTSLLYSRLHSKKRSSFFIYLFYLFDCISILCFDPHKIFHDYGFYFLICGNLMYCLWLLSFKRNLSLTAGILSLLCILMIEIWFSSVDGNYYLLLLELELILALSLHFFNDGTPIFASSLFLVTSGFLKLIEVFYWRKFILQGFAGRQVLDLLKIVNIRTEYGANLLLKILIDSLHFVGCTLLLYEV